MEVIEVKKGILCLLLLYSLFVTFLKCSAQETLYSYFEGSLLAQNDPNAVEWTWDEFYKILVDMAAKDITVSEETIAQIENRKISDTEKVEKNAVLRILLEGDMGPRSNWSIEEKHRFDDLLAAYGLMRNPVAVLPGENDIKQEEAEAAAKDYLQKAYHVPEDLLKGYKINAFFELMTGPADKGDVQAPYWTFTFITPEGAEEYSVTLTSKGAVQNSVDLIKRKSEEDPLKTYLEQAEAEKGVFHFWPLKDKVEFSKKIRAMVENRLSQGYTVFPLAQTIADTKFRLLGERDITEEEAISLAVQAVKKAQGFQDGWENGYSIGRSLFDNKEGLSIWRITFWIKDRSSSCAYRRGRVQLNAFTGEVLSCDADGATFDTSVPYEEMI